MRIKAIEARIARLEASQRYDALARIPDAELDRQIVAGLSGLAAEHGNIGAAVSYLEGTGDYADRELAKAITTCLEEWRPAAQ